MKSQTFRPRTRCVITAGPNTTSGHGEAGKERALRIQSWARVKSHKRSSWGHLVSSLPLRDPLGQKGEINAGKSLQRRRWEEQDAGTKGGRGEPVTAAWSQGPQPRLLLSQTPAARSPTFPRVRLPACLPPSLSSSPRSKTPGEKLTQHSCHTGKSRALGPILCAELLPRPTLIQTPQPSHLPLVAVLQDFLPSPNLASCKKKKKEKKKSRSPMWHKTKEEAMVLLVWEEATKASHILQHSLPRRQATSQGQFSHLFPACRL